MEVKKPRLGTRILGDILMIFVAILTGVAISKFVIFKATVELGGTLSGEHGIGISKAPFMHLAFSDGEMELFRSIKKAFDPNNILNPFKMGL